MGIQGQILETIKKLVKKRWIRLIEMSNKLHLGENQEIKWMEQYLDHSESYNYEK